MAKDRPPPSFSLAHAVQRPSELDDPAAQHDNPLERRMLFGRQRVELHQLRFRENSGERIVQRMLKAQRNFARRDEPPRAHHLRRVLAPGMRELLADPRHQLQPNLGGRHARGSRSREGRVLIRGLTRDHHERAGETHRPHPRGRHRSIARVRAPVDHDHIARGPRFEIRGIERVRLGAWKLRDKNVVDGARVRVVGAEHDYTQRVHAFTSRLAKSGHCTGRSRPVDFRMVTHDTSTEQNDVRSKLDAVVHEYHQRGDVARLLGSLADIAASASTAALVAAVEPYREMHEVAGPIYEVIVDREPKNARAIVTLANAYWLTGRGPDVVSELASRALTADPANRAAWHLWALSESSPRTRVKRWQQIATRFPDDDLAKANLADNAAALAGAENDPVALKLAIATYETLLASATHPAQRAALENALKTLKNWSL